MDTSARTGEETNGEKGKVIMPKRLVDLIGSDALDQLKIRRMSGSDPMNVTEMVSFIDTYALDNAINDHEELAVFVGTDSTKRGKLCVYASAIILYNVGHGAKVFVCKTSEYGVVSNEERLMRETEYSIAFALRLNETCAKYNIPLTIHCDYNPDKSALSNTIVASALGYIRGMGFHGEIKPNAFAATTCADKILEK